MVRGRILVIDLLKSFVLITLRRNHAANLNNCSIIPFPTEEASQASK